MSEIIKTTGHLKGIEVQFELGDYLTLKQDSHHKGWVSMILVESLDAVTIINDERYGPGLPNLLTDIRQTEDWGVAYEQFSNRPFEIVDPHRAVITPTVVSQMAVDEANIYYPHDAALNKLSPQVPPRYRLGEIVRLSAAHPEPKVKAGTIMMIHGIGWLPDQFINMINTMVEPEHKRLNGYRYLASTYHDDGILGSRVQVNESRLSPLVHG